MSQTFSFPCILTKLRKASLKRRAPASDSGKSLLEHVSTCKFYQLRRQPEQRSLISVLTDTSRFSFACSAFPLCTSFSTHDETMYLKNLTLSHMQKKKEVWLFQLQISIFKMSLFKTIHICQHVGKNFARTNKRHISL